MRALANHPSAPDSIQSTDNVPGVACLLHSQSLYGVRLTLAKHVLATHEELRVLRRCAQLLAAQTPRSLQVLAAAAPHKSEFIVNTLQHLGVSCGRIELRTLDEAPQGEDTIWLFVTEAA